MEIKHIFIIGAGTMGNGIAQVAATSGYQVTCMDVVPAALEKGRAAIAKSVDKLVQRQLVTREFDPADRRRVTLALTGRGRAILQSARAPTQAYLGEVLSALSPAERATVVQALRVLRPLFISDREKEMQLAKGQHGDP